MRLALISDIHANLPALEAVLADIEGHSVSTTYHIGDLVGYASWPNEAVGLLREREIAGVAGNYDSTIAVGADHCGCKYEDQQQEALSRASYAWTRAHTSAQSKRYLASLPFRLDIRPGGGHVAAPSIILVHGSPVLNTVYWTANRPDDFCRKMAAVAGARDGDVLAFGHTHEPWSRTVDGVRFVNTGSVGRPKDGDWRAGYALLETHKGDVAVDIVRVEYDLDAAVEGVRASDLPDEFAEQLRTGS